MIDFRYAYLYKNGKQTSCMVAVIDMTAGVVAANCIDLTSDNKVDTSVKYKIHYTPYGNNTGPMFDLSPSEFTIHPDYDPKTLLNNIAVIQNTNGGTDGYSSYISTKDFDVISKVYVRRDYDTITSTWSMPALANNKVSDSDCVDGSPMYAANSRYMILNYYIGLWPYLGFIVKTLNQKVHVYTQNGTALYSDMDIFSMNKTADASSLTNTTLVGGDLYPMQRSREDITETTSLLSDNKFIVILESTGSSDDGNDDADQGLGELLTEKTPDVTDNNGGLSEGEKIAIGVAVPLGVILLIVGAIIVHHIWKINRQDKAWDPAAETWNMQDIAIDIRADEMNIPSPFAQMNMHDNLFVIHADTSAELKK
ncbi:hypothetical protein GGH99_000087 [Coemansia sp. RSA 1285]|nr:hypothetical protein GGH99_000087 [Coemansia sp. RSA 1285]